MNGELYGSLKLPPPTRSAPNLVTLTGTVVPTAGVADVCLDNGIVLYNVVLTSGMGVPLLIGTDVLEANDGVLDYSQNVLMLGSRKYSFIQQLTRSPGVAEVLLESDLDQLTGQYKDVFYDEVRGLQEATGLLPMGIETVGDPVYQRPYRAALTKRQVIETEIDQMLTDGVIEPSSSPWASPVTLVPKKDGTWRFCVDYRGLNERTKKDRFPLPHVQDVFDNAGKGRVFSTLDLKSGYWQLPVAAEDQEKTAFICHRGQFSYKRVSFGLANAPAHFQRTMSRVLAPLLGVCALVYIDDIIVYSRDLAEHVQHLRQVFDLLRAHGLQLKRGKCVFGQPSVELLGYRIDARGIAPLPGKTRAIADLPPPKSVSEIRRFLGMTNYYRQCVPDYAKVAEPIVRLTRKSEDFKWGPAQGHAFGDLKALLVSPAVMAHPDAFAPYRLYTDACDYAIGGILCQMDTNGVERVIQYISHQLNPVQRRWATIEKEAFAVVYALQKLRPYLLGAEFTVYTDHKPLKSLFTKEMANTKIQRWAVLLAEYGAKIEYRQGRNNIRADMLSRITTSEMTEPLPVSVITRGMSDPAEVNIDDQVGICRRYGLKPAEVRRAQVADYPTEIEEAQYDEESDFTYTDRVLRSERLPQQGAALLARIVLPPRYQTDVIRQAHENSGHSGSIKTMKRVQEDFVWKGMRRDVRTHIDGCAICKAFHSSSARAPPRDVDVPLTPMQMIGMDFIGPFREDNVECRYVLTLIDYTSGWAEAYRTIGQTSAEVIDSLTQEFIPRHGVPRVLVADNASCFTSAEFERFAEQAGIELRHSTPYHPQGNSRVERFNGTIKRLIAKACKNHPEEWYMHVNAALAAYRTAVSETTGFTPFYLLYGRRAQVPLETFLSARRDEFGNRLDELAGAYQEARENTENARKYNRARLAARANVDASLRVGDTVIVKAEEAVTNTSKWDPQFQVIRVEGTTHWLRHQVTGQERRVHREKVRLVDPELVWDGLPRRPRRQQARPAPIRQSARLQSKVQEH